MMKWSGAILLLLLLPACASIPRKGVPPEVGHRERGVASWYGPKFHGRKTSSGEVYNMFGLTAAHRTLPLGTRLFVRNEENGKSIRVRVNDRGPFVSGRILDLSYGAARSIGMIGAGTAVVSLEVIGFEPIGGKRGDDRTAPFTLQVGAFEFPENAARLKRELAERYSMPVSILKYETNDRVFYRVRMGMFSSEEAARKMIRSLSKTEQFTPLITRSE
ncbi:MAG TPA: septal ring lytic transglycosylase RlpA family protein [Nitrospiria bacterium]|nr:septal ring lytic transglycosylase RlpA family protein [Nitrospiria bacterium]